MIGKVTSHALSRATEESTLNTIPERNAHYGNDLFEPSTRAGRAGEIPNTNLPSRVLVDQLAKEGICIFLKGAEKVQLSSRCTKEQVSKLLELISKHEEPRFFLVESAANGAILGINSYASNDGFMKALGEFSHQMHLSSFPQEVSKSKQVELLRQILSDLP